VQYSNFTYEEIKNSIANYEVTCRLLIRLAKDEDTKIKMQEILLNGGYNGFNIHSSLTSKNNPLIEAQRRLSYAYLALRNPKTFDTVVENNINLYHGTKATNLRSILKHGLCTIDESSKQGISINTGEEWSRVNGTRDFISFTDIPDIAEGYASIHEDPNDPLSFEMIIGITEEDAIKSKICPIGSDIPEIGIKNTIPPENIRTIFVPTEKLELTKSMLENTGIKVCSVDESKGKFYYFDDMFCVYLSEPTYKQLIGNLMNQNMEMTEETISRTL